jgi:glutathione S-transferase
MSELEIHGKVQCPYAWRARIAARLKDVVYEWIPHDVDAKERDPRAAQHNPDERSPLLHEDGFTLVESLVIAQYLDESRPSQGARLVPDDARARAALRVQLAQLDALMLPHPFTPPLPPEKKKKLDGARDLVEKLLGDGRAFLGGDAPNLLDVSAWPALAAHAHEGVAMHDKTRAYWERVKQHVAFAATKPQSP